MQFANDNIGEISWTRSVIEGNQCKYREFIYIAKRFFANDNTSLSPVMREDRIYCNSYEAFLRLLSVWNSEAAADTGYVYVYYPKAISQTDNNKIIAAKLLAVSEALADLGKLWEDSTMTDSLEAIDFTIVLPMPCNKFAAEFRYLSSDIVKYYFLDIN